MKTNRGLSLIVVALLASPWLVHSASNEDNQPKINSVDVKRGKIMIDGEIHFLDKCIGEFAHELVAQANILTARANSNYGLSEELAYSCPSFVWVVLQADSLSAGDKKQAFADVMNWSTDQRKKFVAPLKQEVDSATNAYWKKNSKAN